MGSNSAQKSGLAPEAITRLVEGRQQFLSFLQKRIQSKAAAEDILQAAFVRGLEKGGTVRDEESAVAWFYRILRNAIIDYYRQQGSAERTSEQLVAHLEDHQDPDDVFKGEICQCVASLLENVKPEYREAIQAIDLNDGSLADLAAKAGITFNNAAVRVHRAREALRKQVMTACGICATHRCIDCDCKPKETAGNFSPQNASASPASLHNRRGLPC